MKITKRYIELCSNLEIRIQTGMKDRMFRQPGPIVWGLHNSWAKVRCQDSLTSSLTRPIATQTFAYLKWITKEPTKWSIQELLQHILGPGLLQHLLQPCFSDLLKISGNRLCIIYLPHSHAHIFAGLHHTKKREYTEILIGKNYIALHNRMSGEWVDRDKVLKM